MQVSSWNPFRKRTDGDDGRAPNERRLPHLPRLLDRRTLIVAGLLLLVTIGLGCWLALEASRARTNLEAARDNAQQAKEALLQGDSEAATRWARHARSRAEAAHNSAHSLPWSIAAVVPQLGSPFKTGQQISDVVLGLTVDVLQPSAEVAAALSPDRLLQGGRVDVQLLRSNEPTLSKIASAADKLGADAEAISEPAYMSAVGDARTQLQTQTAEISDLLHNTALAARLAPAMMGADGPRNYFMGFQTNAEARGTGGLLGGFGVVRFENGAPTFETLGANTEFDKPFAPIDLGPDFNAQWGFSEPTTDFRNSNLSPHFPYAAQIWKSMWAQQSGLNVDGVITVDPIALSYILGAVGPVTMPDGENINKGNVVELTESTVYSRFPVDQVARKNYLQDVAGEVVKKISGPVDSPRELLDALGRAVSEGRIAVWSAVPEEQRLLEETPLAHIVPQDPAPYAAVVFNNLSGNKIDYYLRREIEYVADGCDGDKRKSTVTIKFKNTVPDGALPDYVVASPGLPPTLQAEVQTGTNVSSVSLIATSGAELVGALANGKKVPVFTGTERGHPIFEVQVAIPRGQSGELKFLLNEPTVPGTPQVPIQPLVDNPVPVVSVPECSG